MGDSAVEQDRVPGCRVSMVDGLDRRVQVTQALGHPATTHQHVTELVVIQRLQAGIGCDRDESAGLVQRGQSPGQAAQFGFAGSDADPDPGSQPVLDHPAVLGQRVQRSAQQWQRSGRSTGMVLRNTLLVQSTRSLDLLLARACCHTVS